MNILFLTLLDFDKIEEQGIYTDLIKEFINNKHSIYIISPTEKRSKKKTHLINTDACSILKLRIGNIQKTNIVEKGINTLLLEKKFITGINKYFGSIKFDLILYSTPPITLQKAVEFVKKRDGAKTYLLLKDIFPQNALDLGMLSKNGIKGILYKNFRRKEKKLYNISDYIGCMSEANARYLLDNNKEVNKSKVEVCPNSITPVEIEVDAESIKKKYNLPKDKILYVYGGNLGKPQGVEFIIECLRINEKRKDSHIIIVGAGTEKYKLDNYFNEERPKNSIFINHLSKKDYEELVASCDVGLIFLDNRFTIPNFPSRMLSYMQSYLPIIAATDFNTDIGEIIEKGEFGYWCESGDVNNFKRLMDNFVNKEICIKMGKNSRGYLEKHYTAKKSYDIIMEHFISEKGDKDV